MTPPLVLGLFHASACRVWSMESGRVRALAAEALLQGSCLGLFGTTDIDCESDTVRYMRMTPDGWSPWRGPMPDVVLGGAPIPGDSDSPAVARLRALAPFTGRALPNKVAVSEALQTTAMAPHVIPFRRVVGPDAESVIASFLDEHRRAVLKPAYEHLGKGVTFVACDGDDIVVRQNDFRWRFPRDKALAELAGRIGIRPWIIQAMIISRVRDGRVFDVRVHAHKDGDGRWALVRSYVRLSEAGRLVSNTGRGGFQGNLDNVLAGLGDRGVELAARIRRLGIRIGETLDARYGGRLDEIGVDILVDPQHRPWIAEVNSGPVTRYHEFDRARLHVAYAMHVARRFQAEGRLRARPAPCAVAMQRPPLLGLFHASACRIWAMENRRARALAGEAALQGATVGLFGATDLDFESGTVRYMRMTPEGWSLWRGPMPDVVLIGRSIAGDAESPIVTRLRTLAPVASWTLPDKLAVSEALRSTALAPHVIPFRRVAAPDAQAVIASFLDEHRRIVLKPADEHFGKRIFFVACDGDDIVVRQFEHRWRWPREKGLAELAGRIGDRPWIAQTMIVSRVRDGRAFDIFVHAHKDGNGRWTPVRCYARLAEAGVLATITGRGGYLGDLDALLAGLGDRGAVLAAAVRRLGVRIGEALDAIFGGELDEIGVDIVVDPQHRPWIVEVNSGPVTRFHEFERARLHVAHAVRLARRSRAVAGTGTSRSVAK